MVSRGRVRPPSTCAKLYSFAAAMASTLIHMAPFSGMLIWKKTDPAREKRAGLHSVRENQARYQPRSFRRN